MSTPSNSGKAIMSTTTPNLASTSGSGSRDVFPDVFRTQWDKDTSESFDHEDTESDKFESLPPSPNAEESFWEFKESDPGPLLGKEFDQEQFRPHQPPSPSHSTFFPSLEAKASPPHSSTAEKRGKETAPPTEDLACPVKGMYRLLDLITEQGSSGLVDKIVISQESLQAFINALSPGAYSSITRVNFKILDDLLLKPIGVYGSREEIVKFFREMGAIDVEMCVFP